MKLSNHIKRQILSLVFAALATVPIGIYMALTKDHPRSIWLGITLIFFTVLAIIQCSLHVYETQKSEADDKELILTRQKIQEVQFQKRQEQLNALQNQINPHFLYNTLDTIRGMAYEAEAVNVADIVSRLSSMFKYSMDYSDALVRVQDEIENLDSFLMIQDLRFAGFFTLEKVFDCDPDDLATVMIPKLTLQPIAENVFKHAFRNKAGGGLISVRFSRTNECFQIIVSDNGAGIPDETLMKINRLFHEDNETPGLGADSMHSGIALKNIDARIKINFGSAYGLRVNSTVGIGTSVVITLPPNGNKLRTDKPNET